MRRYQYIRDDAVWLDRIILVGYVFVLLACVGVVGLVLYRAAGG